MNHIYLLIDPTDNIVRYVGKTKHPKSRYKQHIADAHKKQNTEKQRWILKLESKSMKPLIKIVDSIECDIEARKVEEKTVMKYVDTVFNIHMPGKGSLSVAHYRKTGKLKKCK